MDKQIDKLTQLALKFRDDRDWSQFHTGRDLSMCLSIEANELLELFLWKTEDEIDKTKLYEEIGDVFYVLLLLANKYNINIENAFKEKLGKNSIKYPIDEFQGSNKKYNE